MLLGLGGPLWMTAAFWVAVSTGKVKTTALILRATGAP